MLLLETVDLITEIPMSFSSFFFKNVQLVAESDVLNTTEKRWLSVGLANVRY